MDEERRQRNARLTPDQKWQIFLEASRKGTSDAEVCRKWGISTYQLKAIRAKVNDESLEALRKGRGRRKTDQQVTQLLQGLVGPTGRRLSQWPRSQSG